MILKLKRTPGIYLVGFMASGKSTIGVRLADELGWSFFDLDAEIEAERKTTIAEIFDTLGEAEFRRIESTALNQRIRAIQSGRPSVLALGGGAFTEDENIGLMNENGITIWLDCPLDEIRMRLMNDPVDRPLARDPKRLEHLYESRRISYTQADFRVDASGAADPLAQILALPLFS
ncbi:MAG: shikimate kinase [Bryobacteraceae bacterium]